MSRSGDEEKNHNNYSSSLTSRSTRIADVTATAASTSAPANHNAAVSLTRDIEPTLDSNSDVTSSDDDDETQVKHRHESTPSPPTPLPPSRSHARRSRDAGKVIRVDVEPLLRMQATSLSVDTTSPGAYFATMPFSHVELNLAFSSLITTRTCVHLVYQRISNNVCNLYCVCVCCLLHATLGGG